IVMGLISLMSVVTLRDDLGGTGVDAGSLTLVGRSLVAFHDWTFLLGPQFCAGFGNGLLLGYLMYKSQLVPPRMALVGLIGGPLAFFGGVLALFGVVDHPSGGLFVLDHPGDRVGGLHRHLLDVRGVQAVVTSPRRGSYLGELWLL